MNRFYLRFVVGFPLAVCLAFLAGLPQPAFADQEFVTKTRQRILTGDMAVLSELTEASTLKRAAGTPEDWANLCETIWKSSGILVHTHPKKGLKVVAAVAGHAATLYKASSDDPWLIMGDAWGKLAVFRARAALESKQDLSGWAEAAEQLLGQSGHFGDLAGQAAESFLEAAAVPGADADALIARSEVARDEGLGRFSKDEEKAVFGALWCADRAHFELARKKKSAAKAQLQAGVELLAPFLEGEKPSTPISDAHAALARINLLGKLKIKQAAPRVKIHKISKSGLQIELPESSSWEFPERATKQNFEVQQRVPKGPLLRYVSLVAYPTGPKLNYASGSTVTIGDTKAMVAADVDGVESSDEFSSIDRVSKPKKSKLHKGFKDVMVGEVEGILAKGARWVHRRVYYFNAKATKMTYRLIVGQYARLPVGDAEFEYVLKSLRVAKK